MSRKKVSAPGRGPASGEGERRFTTVEDVQREGDRVVESILRAIQVYDVTPATIERCAAHARTCGFVDQDFVVGRHKDWYAEIEAVRAAAGGGPYHARVAEARRDPDSAFLRWFEDHVRRDDYYLERIVPGAARREAAGILGDAWHANRFHRIVWPREIALARLMRIGRQKQKAVLAQIFLAQVREQPAMAYVGLARLYAKAPVSELDTGFAGSDATGPDDLTVAALAASEEGPAGAEIDFDLLLAAEPLWLRWILAEDGDISGQINRLPREEFGKLVQVSRREAESEQREETRRRFTAHLRDEESRKGPWLDVSFLTRAKALGYTSNQYVAAFERLLRHRIGSAPSLDARIDGNDPGSLLVSWLEALAKEKPEPEAPCERGMMFARIDVDGVDPGWMEERLPSSWRLFDHARWDRMTRWRRQIAENKREVPLDLAVDYAFFLLDDVRRHPVPDEATFNDEEDVLYAD